MFEIFLSPTKKVSIGGLVCILSAVIFFPWFLNGFWLKLAGWSKLAYVFGVLLLCVLTFCLSGHVGPLFIFYNESKAELSKVIWPQKNEVIKITGIVIIVVSIVSILLWCIDGFLFSLINRLTQF